MNSLFRYLLLANLLLMLQAAFYHFFLSRQQRFSLNRLVLLAGLTAAWLLPLLRLPLAPSIIPAPWEGVVELGALPETTVSSSAAGVSWWERMESWGQWLAWGVALLLLLRLGIRYLRLITLVSRGRRVPMGRYTLVHTEPAVGPASFLKFIFWDDKLELDEEARSVALAHERCHSEQWHSIDVLYLELLQLIAWFNPAYYLIRHHLRQTHEFLADDAARQVAGTQGLKRLLLLKHLHSMSLPSLNQFFSHTKSRILMLNTETRRKRLLPYLFLLPLAGLLLIGSQQLAQSPATGAAISPTTEVETKVDDLPEVDSFPKPINLVEVANNIGYPKEAKDDKAEGKAIVRVLVGENGLVLRRELVKKVHPAIDERVLQGSLLLRFEPATKNGKPIKCWITIPFKFALDS